MASSGGSIFIQQKFHSILPLDVTIFPDNIFEENIADIGPCIRINANLKPVDEEIIKENTLKYNEKQYKNKGLILEDTFTFFGSYYGEQKKTK